MVAIADSNAIPLAISGVVCDRQLHDKFAAFTLPFTKGFDAAAVKLNDTSRQRESNAQTAVTALLAAVGLKEHIEKVR